MVMRVDQAVAYGQSEAWFQTKSGFVARKRDQCAFASVGVDTQEGRHLLISLLFRSEDQQPLLSAQVASLGNSSLLEIVESQS
jgi:hypothetical protein